MNHGSNNKQSNPFRGNTINWAYRRTVLHLGQRRNPWYWTIRRPEFSKSLSEDESQH